MKEDIELIIKEYFELNETLKKLNKQKSKLRTILFSAFDSSLVDEMHVEDMCVYRINHPKVIWDEKKLKSILLPKELWEQVLTVENKKVQDLINNGSILESEVSDAKEIKDVWFAYTKYTPRKIPESRCNITTKSESGKIIPIVITNVTRMHGDRVCIFGHNANSFHLNTGIKHSSIRPVIPYSGIKECFLFDKNGTHIIKPFAEIEFKCIQPLPEPPHTEDVEIDPNYLPRLIRNLSEEETRSLLDKILDESVQSIFEATIHENRYIDNGNGKRSLGTVNVKEVKLVQYLKSGEKYEYRLTFSDISGEIYNLPITDCAFRKYCDSCRIYGKMDISTIGTRVQQRLNQAVVYVCIGLTRVFKGVHWLQVTGIHTFPDYKDKDYEKK